jgi:hypothetical protein
LDFTIESYLSKKETCAGREAAIYPKSQLHKTKITDNS